MLMFDDGRFSAKMHSSRCRRWVKTGKAHNGQNISGLPPIADIARQFLEQVGGRPVG
jgi:hypothetical protein